MTFKIIARESGKALTDAGVMLCKGKAALNARRVERYIELLKPTLVDAGVLATNPKFARLEADIAEMAAQIGHAPPKIMVTSQPLGMAAASDKLIFVSQQELEQSTSNELRGIAGHELAHIKRGDHLNFDRPPNHTQELAADRLGVELSGEPEAMISWLERRAKSDPISAQGTLVYPPISKRIEEILKAGKSKSHSAQSRTGSSPVIPSPQTEQGI